MGYENVFSEFYGVRIFFGILEFHSAPVPGIKNDRSLNSFLLQILKTHLYLSYIKFLYVSPTCVVS